MNKTLPCLLFLALSACGPSTQKNKQNQQVREDSIRNAAIKATEERMEAKCALKEQIMLAKNKLAEQENRVSGLKADLAVQKDGLETDKTPQFLRTKTGREAQIRSRTLAIEQAEKSLEESQKSVAETKKEIETLETELQNFK